MELNASLSLGLKYINECLNILNKWVKQGDTKEYSGIIYRGLTGIFNPTYIRSGAAIRLSRSQDDDNLENELNDNSETTEENYKVNQEQEHNEENKTLRKPKMISEYFPNDAKIISSTKYTFSDYISYHEHLIIDAKATDPKSYRDYTDLEVLADLQHYGAATCLVDFSKNFLTSLWFACREPSAKFAKQHDDYQGHYGVVYCYDTADDIIKTNTLSIINHQNAHKSISNLLSQTKKITSFCSDSDYIFYKWEPSNLNVRVARQDSVFIFGLSKFKIKDHRILTIAIHDDAKPYILVALKHIFNISANTIFNDRQGFATINSKMEKSLRLYSMKSASTDDSRGDGSYQQGLLEMFMGNYELALDFFIDKESKLIKNRGEYILKRVHLPTVDFRLEIPYYNNIDDLVELAELYLSKAICYKHFGIIEGDYYGTSYYRNALIEYLKAQSLYSKIFDLSHLEKERYFRKYLRITNDIIQLEYKCKEFQNCVQICKDASKAIDLFSDGLPNSNYSSIFCKIAQLELDILILLTNKNDKEIVNSIQVEWEYTITSIKESGSSRPLNAFNNLLVSFFKCFKEILVEGKEAEKDAKSEILSELYKEFDFNREAIYKNSYLDCINDYSAWDFTEIKDLIEDEQFYHKDRHTLRYLLAVMIQARDFYKVSCLNSNNGY